LSSSNGERHRTAAPTRRGLTLFEVIVALAIFMGSIAAIGQLVATGVRGAVQARLQSQAVIRCESKMGEIVSGVLSLRSASANVPFPDDSSWNWTVAVASGPHDGLYIVEVTVSHPSGTVAGNQSFALRRLVRDPQLALDAYAKQQADAANSASSSTSSGTGTSGGSSSSGGSK
jgi:prepilin-type N-terminal cleavage/methylation domain-containing protein